MFSIRSLPARLGTAFLLPSTATLPLLMADEPERVRVGPLLTLAVVAVACLAGSGAGAAAGAYTFLVYWRDVVPPASSFALPDRTAQATLLAMGLTMAAVSFATRRLERWVEQLKELDAFRRAATNMEARLRDDAESSASQVRAALAVANLLAGASTVQDVASLAVNALDVPERPTAAAVAVIDAGRVKLFAARGVSRAMQARLAALDARELAWLAPVLRGEPVFVDDPDTLAFPSPDVAERSVLTGSWALLPFRAADTRGLLAVYFDGPRRPSAARIYYSLVAEIIASAIERASAYERLEVQLADVEQSLRERDRIARTLSTSLLPPTLPRLAGFSLAAWLMPASDQVAGDFYDVFSVGDGDWIAVLGDVSGKGAEAAAVTSLARYATRVASLSDPDPEQVAAVANAALVEDRSDLFCTMAIVRYHRELEEVEVVLAGHLQARRVSEVGVTRLGHFTPPLGIAGVERRGEREPFRPGDKLVMFSDGLVERSPDYGENELDADLREWSTLPPEAVAGGLRDRLLAQATHREDDVAVLVIARLTNEAE